MPSKSREVGNKISQGSFISGVAIDFKNGGPGAMLDSEAMDFRQRISQMSVLPGARNLSSVLSDMPTAIVQTPDGFRYMLGDQGHFYKIDLSNNITEISGSPINSNGAAGLIYNQQTDYIYIAGQQTISTYGPVLKGGATLNKDQFGPSASVANGTINLYDSATNAYDIPRNNAASATVGGITRANYQTLVTNALATATTAINSNTISEAVGKFCPFIPDIEPFYSVPVWVTNIGSGDLILTMHDSVNTLLGAVTIPNASLQVGWNEFIFTAPGIRAIPNAFASGIAAGYHFHLTSSVNGDTTTVASVNSNDQTGVNFLLFAYRLVATNNGWHPMAIFGQFLLIGNGPYVSTYNFSNDASPNNGQWIRHQLSLDFGFEVTSLDGNNQMAAIAAEKRSTQNTRNFQDGYLYFWDGVNVNFNSKIRSNRGAPYALSSKDNINYFISGGYLMAYGGGQSIIPVRYIGFMNTDYLGVEDATIVNPNMITMRYGIMLIGYPSSTTNVNLKFGVYSWGAAALDYPNSFGYSYRATIAGSQGYNYSTANKMQLGMVQNFVDATFISWKYWTGSAWVYGVDVVDNSSTPAPVYSAHNLIWDGGVRWKPKKAFRVKVNFLPLPANTTLKIDYTLDRGTLQQASVSASAGDTSAVIEIDTNFYEISWGFSGTCASNAAGAPTITGWACEVDPLPLATDLRGDDIPGSASGEAF